MQIIGDSCINLDLPNVKYQKLFIMLGLANVKYQKQLIMVSDLEPSHPIAWQDLKKQSADQTNWQGEAF